MKLAVFGLAGLIVSSAALAATPSRTANSPPFKVYISVDMEGVAGTVTSDQLVPTGK
jgi:hypothetical protein